MKAMDKLAKYRADLAQLWLLYRSNRPILRMLLKIKANHLTFLRLGDLAGLYHAVSEIETNRREGVIVEAGCALGGSALALTAAKSPTRPLWLYDTFGMIPPPSERDDRDVHARYQVIAAGQARGIGGGLYYGYEPNLLARVKTNFVQYGFPPESHQIHFAPGVYEETLHLEQPLALAHIDCDWHDSVMVCLQRLEPRLVNGGILVINDYLGWSGCRRAVDSYFADKRSGFQFELTNYLLIRKITDR